MIFSLIVCVSAAQAEDNPSVLSAMEAFQKERVQAVQNSPDSLAFLPKSTCGCRADEGDPSMMQRLQEIKDQEHPRQDQKDIKVLVFVSSSMHDHDLKRLAEEAHHLQAALVIRGLVEGSFQKTLPWVQNLKGSVMIDPRLFKAFQVTSVPTFVRLHQPLKIQGGMPTFEVPEHDVVRGNLTLEGALRVMEGKGV